MNPDLQTYIENEILPRYRAFDAAHRIDHARSVIERSLRLAERCKADPDMAYTVAAYHDLGLCDGREPRSVYGRIVAEADRCLDPDTVLRRTIQYGLEHYPDLDREGQYARCCDHLLRKYADGGYLRLWISCSDNERQLKTLRGLIRSRDQLRRCFDAIFGQVTGR